MEPPILLYYTLGPFYQSYSDYLKSEVKNELYGNEAADGEREKKCSNELTRIGPNGEDIVPCGLKAYSFFNDTFQVTKLAQGNTSQFAGLPLAIDTAGVAWDSDVERYNNPEDYMPRPDTQELYERYPFHPNLREQGVKNE